MIFALDIGNTNIVIGCIEGNDIHFTTRFSTDRSKTEDEYALKLKSLFDFYQIDPKEIEGAIISSVVPQLKSILSMATKKISGKTPLIVCHDMDLGGLKIGVDYPEQLGKDLIVNAVAAIKEYPKPIIIFDMGTATTLSVIDKDENYLGGMIIPGLQLSMDALSARTSQLPKVSLDAPKNAIGKNTIDCMKAGAIFGTASMLDGLIDRVNEELGEETTVLATGGLSKEIVPYCKRKIISDPNLMLRGLKIIYDMNKK